MKKFLLRLLLWFSVLVVLAFVTDYMISSGLRKTDIRKYAVWNDIYAGNIDADLVVLGSSRAWCGYNTYILDSLLNCDSYNLGLDGHNFNMQLVRYETYRRYNSRPKIVIVNTDYLSTLGIMSDERYEREQFFPYIWDDTLISAVKDVKNITVLDRLLPLYRYFGYREDVENGISAFWGQKNFGDGGMHKGYRGNDYVWEVAPLSLVDQTKVEFCDMTVAEKLDSFVQRTCNEDVNVVFVKSPVYESFYEISDAHISDSIFNSIAIHYCIPVLDYYSCEICNDSSNFYNYTHLNKKGSELFTKELCRDLDSLGIIAELKQ